MLLQDLGHETLLSITANKVRSGLTILGIVIGIGSVIGMVSVGQGAQNSISSSIQSIGSNLIMVMPGSSKSSFGGPSAGRGSATTLTSDDATAISTKVSLVKAVASESSHRYQTTYKGNNTNTSVVGTVPAYLVVRSVSMDLGTFVSEQDVRSINKVAVLGPTTRDDLFGVGVNPIGQTIKINKVDFKVIGVTKAKGGSGFGSQDDMIFTSLTASQRYLAGDTYVTQISIEATDENSMTAVQNQVTELLLQRHKISDPTQADFQLMNQSDITSAASSVTGTFTTLLAAIAGISLLVGGIGIMNMMLTNVTERTREIGLRKAIGAKKNEISQQFLMESVVLTFVGGLVGVFLGWLLAFIVSKFFSIAASVSWSSIILAFGVSAGIGIIFGYYPAKRASKLDPIDALRYE